VLLVHGVEAAAKRLVVKLPLTTLLFFWVHPVKRRPGKGFEASTRKNRAKKHAKTQQLSQASLRFRPLTSKNWADVEELLGPRGGWGGCWCIWWRLNRSTFERNKGKKNQHALRRIVASRVPVGVLAYSGREPVGWCAIAPREVYTRLANSRVLKPVDDQAVWSVSCFYVKAGYRRAGLSTALLKAAVDYAHQNGARIVEGYPQEARKNLPDAFAWTGLVATFYRAGFKEVLRRSATRPIMRTKLS
jgi:GNAT superfamily N-acetyltransferase